VMKNIGALSSIEAGNRRNRSHGADEPVTASAPSERTKRETFLCDLRAMSTHPGGNDDIEAVVARRPRHRKPMRAEIPILSDQKQQLGPSLAIPLTGAQG